MRQLLNAFIHLSKWSPVGRFVCFESGEGPAASELTNQRGKIVEIRLTGDGIEALVIRLEAPLRAGGGETTQLVLVPRHSGYGSLALPTTRIVTYVFPESGQLPGMLPDYERMIALMDIRLCKR